MLLRSTFSLLAPPSASARLSVLIFHRVLPRPDPLFPGEADGRWFDAMLGWIGSWFNVLPLDEAVARLKGGGLPARAAAITFDDGYADNFTVALPILKRHGLSASFFIATGYLDGGRMWNDTITESVRYCSTSTLDLRHLALGCHAVGSIDEKRRSIESIINALKYRPGAERIELSEQIADQAKVAPARDLMMTHRQVLALRRAGMQIGAHTVSHPILARIDAREACREIAESKATLEAVLGERVGLFAYPNGKPGQDYRAEDVETVRKLGFDAAVSTAWGAADCRSDPMQIPRFTPWDRSRLRFGARLARNLMATRQGA